MQGHRDVTCAQYLYTALGWRSRSSPRRKRREDKRGETRVPVPVPDPSLLILFAVPHDLDTIWSQPDCTVCTSVPVISLASVAFLEPHPLNGDLQLSSRRGWARLGEQFRPRVRSQLRIKCEKLLYQAHPRHRPNQLESEKTKTLANPVQDENLEDFHRECQRSARQSALLNSVREKNLEDQKFPLHDQELECQRSAPFVAATKNRIRSSALPPAVPQAACRDTNVARGCSRR